MCREYYIKLGYSVEEAKELSKKDDVVLLKELDPETWNNIDPKIWEKMTRR